MISGDVVPVRFFGGGSELAYWPLGDGRAMKRSRVELGFAALAHDWRSREEGFVTGITRNGVSVIAEYRLTLAGIELRRLVESECLGMLTGLVYDEQAQRLLLWDAQGERLFDYSLEHSELRVLADSSSLPALAGYRTLWWLQGSELWISPEFPLHAQNPSDHIVLHDDSAHDGRLDRYQVFNSSGTPRTALKPAPAPSDPTVHQLPRAKAW